MIDAEGYATEAWRIEARTQEMFARQERERRELLERENEKLRTWLGLLFFFTVLYTTVVLAGLSWLFANFTPA